MTDRIASFQYINPSGSRTTLSRRADHARRLIRNLLTAIGEPDRSTLILERIPDGLDFDDARDLLMPMLQVAGSAERMTIEWGKFDEQGEWHIHTLGRGGTHVGPPPTRIQFGEKGTSLHVYPDEVFDAEEAIEIFESFLFHGSPPSHYELREVDLTWPKPTP